LSQTTPVLTHYSTLGPVINEWHIAVTGYENYRNFQLGSNLQ